MRTAARGGQQLTTNRQHCVAYPEVRCHTPHLQMPTCNNIHTYIHMTRPHLNTNTQNERAHTDTKQSYYGTIHPRQYLKSTQKPALSPQNCRLNPATRASHRHKNCTSYTEERHYDCWLLATAPSPNLASSCELPAAAAPAGTPDASNTCNLAACVVTPANAAAPLQPL